MDIVNTYSTKGDSIEILLRQIGATSITRVKGYIYFIKFKIDDIEITYTYNINHKNQYFLQRIEPYPLGKGIFNNDTELEAELNAVGMKEFFDTLEGKVKEYYI